MLRGFFIVCLFFGVVTASYPQFSERAQWISTMESQSATNTWLGYRKTFDLEQVPAQTNVRIAVDSKYWLWVNGERVVFEGGLKRGPTPLDTYYDEVDLSGYLSEGENTIAVLVWYFGKDGFAHRSSGRAGLIFDSDFGLESDGTWRCAVAHAYGTAGAPHPNFRLAESSIQYDARLGWHNWQSTDYDDSWMPQAEVIGQAGSYPWNTLVKRPIPFWKDYGLRAFQNAVAFPFVSRGDTLVFDLPYNAQITPYLEVEAGEGNLISVFTDNYLTYHGSAPNLRAEYVTRNGAQQYESLGWMNGHKVYFVIPEGVTVRDIKYRETGYDTEFSGRFTSADPFFNRLWEKSLRTLYVTMRDNYMDCPERERAQWTGDAVNQSGQAFYALSTSSHAMAKKWLSELIGWQRADGSIYAPVPAGNWTNELPSQSMASVGYYGLWNYYHHTGDKETLSNLYDGVKQYLSVWEQVGDGTVKLREGGWTWGDWGDNRDMLLIFNLWYYLGLKGMYLSAGELGFATDQAYYKQAMERFEATFNQRYWTGRAYRDPAYEGETDDRVQALAVVSGVADRAKYPAILEVFLKEEHASPYMEKYVLEAMFRMGYEKDALARHRKRFGPMVNDDRFTTLFEGWGIGSEGFGGGTVNHSWSGGGLIVLSQYLCGIAPLTPAYQTFQIIPQPGDIKHASAVVPSVAGEIRSSYEVDGTTFRMRATVPRGTHAVLGVANHYPSVKVNGIVVFDKGKFKRNGVAEEALGFHREGYRLLMVPEGNWEVEAF